MTRWESPWIVRRPIVPPCEAEHCTEHNDCDGDTQAVEVDAYAESLCPAEGDGWNSPRIAAHYEDVGATLNGDEFALTDEEMAMIGEAALDDAREDDTDRIAESRAEDARDEMRYRGTL